MKLSARNVLKGKVTKVVEGEVNTEVVIKVTDNAEVVAMITKSSADRLGLAEGKSVYAVIKASNVMVGVD